MEFRAKLELTREQTLCLRKLKRSAMSKEFKSSLRQLMTIGQQDVLSARLVASKIQC